MVIGILRISAIQTCLTAIWLSSKGIYEVNNIERAKLAKTQVMVVDKQVIEEIGYFTGIQLQNIERYYFEVLNNYFFLNKEKAEHDRRYKQIIPYVVVTYRSQFFISKRKTIAGPGSEERLYGKYSIGLGGHINPRDEGGTESVIREAMKRELWEEANFDIQRARSVELVCLVNDDSDLVSQTHFGFVYKVELAEPTLQVNSSELKAGTFLDINGLEDYIDRMEKWSQLLYKEYMVKQGRRSLKK